MPDIVLSLAIVLCCYVVPHSEPSMANAYLASNCSVYTHRSLARTEQFCLIMDLKEKYVKMIHCFLPRRISTSKTYKINKA